MSHRSLFSLESIIGTSTLLTDESWMKTLYPTLLDISFLSVLISSTLKMTFQSGGRKPAILRHESTKFTIFLSLKEGCDNCHNVYVHLGA